MVAPTVTLLQVTPNSEQAIASYAAICYGSKVDGDSNARRIKHLVGSGHLATLRFAHATFAVGGITRSCSHQFVRSKHLDFLQQSQRYVNQHNSHFTIPTSVLKNQTALKEYTNAVNGSFQTYDKLIESGIRKEDARFVLPEATHTTLIVTGNFQAWRDFLNLRLTEASQWEIRDVASKILVALNKEAPVVFPIDIVEKV